MPKFLKIVLVIIGATAITALGIDAADTLSGSRNTLLGQLVGSESGACPAGMIELAAATTFTCVDIFEVSADDSCPYPNPNNAAESTENLSNTSCAAVSKEGKIPWRFVSRDQAQTVCLRSGKRLPTNHEWHFFALGTPSNACNIDSSGVSESGFEADCASAVGVYDAVGNAWEWTSDDVVEGQLDGRSLPETGYVQSADAAGIAVETADNAVAQYDNDYFWSRNDAVSAVMRGGFYGSGDDAGVYSTHADVPLTMVGEAIGFRCVQ